MVSGTSIGALIGALYVLRGDIAAVEEYALGFENSNLYPHLVAAPLQLGDDLGKTDPAFLHGLFGARRIEDLERPFFCPAADIRSGREVMFERGSLRRPCARPSPCPSSSSRSACAASYLVDGGLLNPVPVDVLKKHGAASPSPSTSSTPRPLRPRRRKKANVKEKLLLARLDDFLSRRLISGSPDEEPNMIEAFLSTMEIMQQKLIAARLGNDVPDAIIHVETSDIKLFEFYRPAEIIRRGEEAARRQLGEIERLLRRRRRAAAAKGG